MEDCAEFEISSTEFKTIEKVINVLKLFEEATRELSRHDASISTAIPHVTLLLKSLEEESQDDHGVLTMKRTLAQSMRYRFRNMEQNKRYNVATLLDPRWKHHFYRDPDVLEMAKTTAIEEIMDLLRNNSTQPQVRKYQMPLTVSILNWHREL